MIYLLLVSLLLVSFTACSEENEAEGEFDNWQARNEAYFASLEGKSLRKIKAYAKDQTAAGVNTDYIYVEVLEEGSGTETPLFTDSVFYAYRGRLIPSATYGQGYVFQETFTGDFDWRTAGMLKTAVGLNTSSSGTSLFTDGFCTALQNMHKGDLWRIYVPYQLGYGETESSSIPAYSTLIFDIAIADIWHPGDSRPAWRARSLQ